MRNKRKVFMHTHTHSYSISNKVDRIPKIWLRQQWRTKQAERTKWRSIFSIINETPTFTPVIASSNDIVSWVSGASLNWTKLIKGSTYTHTHNCRCLWWGKRVLEEVMSELFPPYSIIWIIQAKGWEGKWNSPTLVILCHISTIAISLCGQESVSVAHMPTHTVFAASLHISQMVRASSAQGPLIFFLSCWSYFLPILKIFCIWTRVCGLLRPSVQGS